MLISIGTAQNAQNKNNFPDSRKNRHPAGHPKSAKSYTIRRFSAQNFPTDRPSVPTFPSSKRSSGLRPWSGKCKAFAEYVERAKRTKHTYQGEKDAAEITKRRRVTITVRMSEANERGGYET